MADMVLTRVPSSKFGTFGMLRVDSVPFAVTLERRWENNRPSVNGIPGSCIPLGKYTCKRVKSPKFGDTFEVTGVPNRSKILFHKGNLDDDSHGCILVGEQFALVKNEPGIIASAAGFEEFLAIQKGVKSFQLIINEAA